MKIKQNALPPEKAFCFRGTCMQAATAHRKLRDEARTALVRFFERREQLKRELLAAKENRQRRERIKAEIERLEMEEAAFAKNLMLMELKLKAAASSSRSSRSGRSSGTSSSRSSPTSLATSSDSISSVSSASSTTSSRRASPKFFKDDGGRTLVYLPQTVQNAMKEVLQCWAASIDTLPMKMTLANLQEVNVDGVLAFFSKLARLRVTNIERPVLAFNPSDFVRIENDLFWTAAYFTTDLRHSSSYECKKIIENLKRIDHWRAGLKKRIESKFY